MRATRTRIELDHEAVAPAVFLPRARLDVAHERRRGFRPQHAGAAAELRRADAPANPRLLEQVLHPVRAQPMLGHEVVAAAAAGEPDLDATVASGLPSPRGEVEKFLLVARAPARHAGLREQIPRLHALDARKVGLQATVIE